MSKLLVGKTALITGAGRRIGRETALTLADAGANIIVHYRSSQAEADQLVAELEREHCVRAWSVQADFANAEETETLIERAVNLAGSLDILVNNASEFPTDTLDSMTLDGLTSSLLVNAWTPFLLSRSFAIRVGKGKIVNMLDSRIRGYDWKHVSYILAKHVLEVMTRMMALEYAPNIEVNGVAPGLILPPPGKDMSFLDKMVDTVPMKKHGGPQDIADAIRYLVESTFVTGEVIYVDGGRHLKEFIGEPKGTE